MRTCDICGCRLHNKMMVNGTLKYANKRKTCPDCSLNKKKPKRCHDCNELLTVENSYSKTTGCLQSKCKKCNYVDRVQRLRDFKKRCVEYKGGKCIRCGYSEYVGALEFHHRDPKQKDFNIGNNRTAFTEYIKNELDKCDLLCANCHRTVHYEQRIELEMNATVPTRTGQPLQATFC